MNAIKTNGRLFIARHGETIFNASKCIQGEHLHTPLTRNGFAQAEIMGKALASAICPNTDLLLWASATGRALQTLSVICEHLGLDWHSARTDPRLNEIDTGDWGGAYYQDLFDAHGEAAIIDRDTMLLQPAPGGEDYAAIAARVRAWAHDHAHQHGDKLVIMHGISSRVLRGCLLGLEPLPGYDVPVAPNLPQGTVICIENGQERVVVTGSGGTRA